MPVFIAGIGQATTDLSLYQARLQDWYEDAGFWNDLSRFASDWSQEVYGDVRHYAVAGATREARRDLLNEYLQHQSSLAVVAPASADAARSFLVASSSPLANAAWRYDAAFGWTDVPVELMQDYVSAQTYALRSAGNGRFGYAWSPKNLAGIPDATFNAQTDAVLVRLAAAIADSGDTPEAGCGAGWCTGSLDGATATTAWRTFGAWQPSRLAFASPEQTVAPGAASTPLTVELQTSTGTPYTAGVPVTVALSSSSSTGELATGPGGPWTATLTTPIASGVSSTSFYYRDAGVGSATITAAAAGKVTATQSVTVGTAPPSPPASPSSRAAAAGRRRISSSRRPRHLLRRPSATRSRTCSTSGTSAGLRRAHSSPFSFRRRWPTPAASRTAGRLHRCGDARMRSRLPRRRPRRDRADQRRRPRARDAGFQRRLLRAAERLAAGERHGPRRHRRRAAADDPCTRAGPPRAPRSRDPARASRARGVATLSVRFSVGGAARLEARVTPLRSTRPITLLAGTSLAGARATKAQPAAAARVSRAATYLFKARIGATKLIRGRTYLVRLTALDADARRRTLTIRVKA